MLRKGGITLTVLFGTVEYFEKQIQNFLKEKGVFKTSTEQLSDVFSILENELLNEFICAENVREECLENLKKANRSVQKHNSLFLNQELLC
jgi:predicted deacylase